LFAFILSDSSLVSSKKPRFSLSLRELVNLSVDLFLIAIVTLINATKICVYRARARTRETQAISVAVIKRSIVRSSPFSWASSVVVNTLRDYLLVFSRKYDLLQSPFNAFRTHIMSNVNSKQWILVLYITNSPACAYFVRMIMHLFMSNARQMQRSWRRDAFFILIFQKIRDVLQSTKLTIFSEAILLLDIYVTNDLAIIKINISHRAMLKLLCIIFGKTLLLIR